MRPTRPMPASLTVYTDPASGIRIALAARRAGPVAWRRLPGQDLAAAIEGALAAVRGRTAFACVLDGRDRRADPAQALARCLARVGLEGFGAGAEEPGGFHAVAAE
ncbi:MAG TPA: hypothetical protein VEB20_12515 [Azospirillaceae bacterium]|nr:hypothetical protein [Azospirillaceae bacterium]